MRMSVPSESALREPPRPARPSDAYLFTPTVAMIVAVTLMAAYTLPTHR